jgi:hypothetical protein
MGIAFETAVAALHTRDVDPPRDTIARIIIDLAKTGERDPERLCEAALKAVPEYPFVNAPSPLPPHAAGAAGFVNLSQSGERPDR